MTLKFWCPPASSSPRLEFQAVLSCLVWCTDIQTQCFIDVDAKQAFNQVSNICSPMLHLFFCYCCFSNKDSKSNLKDSNTVDYIFFYNEKGKDCRSRGLLFCLAFFQSCQQYLLQMFSKVAFVLFFPGSSQLCILHFQEKSLICQLRMFSTYL